MLLLQLGEDHDRTNESSECLKHLTQQAVKFQKTMNQLSKGEKVNMMSPIQVSVSKGISCPLIRYGDGAGNTFEENSSVFSLIRMRWLPSVL